MYRLTLLICPFLILLYMWSKKCVERGDLKSNDLKKLIVRIDFVGVSNIDKYIDQLINNILRKDNVEEYIKGAISYENHEELKDRARLLGISETEIQNSAVHRFSKLKAYLPNIVYVDVTENSIGLTIECKDYKGFDDYQELLGKMWDSLYVITPFLQIKRVGLRKICAFFAINGKDLRAKVEEKVFPDPMVNEISPHCIYIDKFYWKEEDINCILKRELETGWSYINNKKESAFQFSLDYDLFLDLKLLKNSQKWSDHKNIKDLLGKINNTHFTLFKESMSNSYFEELCDV